MLSSKCAEGMENYCMKLSIIFVWQNEFASSVTDIAIHPNDQRRKENDFLTFFFFAAVLLVLDILLRSDQD